METKTCQNCKGKFVIDKDDFSFYQKIKVPPPTFCPECRFQRRMTWRNERSLYKRTCDLCKNNIISMYPADAVFPVYCRECWYSDKWEATNYGQEYDFSKPFFEQFKELIKKVPVLGIWQRNVINSPYSNMCGECRNVYLSVSVVIGSENIFYSRSVDKSFNIFDSYSVKESDSLYENIEAEKNYNCQHLKLSRNCMDSFFLIDRINCNNCALSSNLRNKEFYFRNKQLSKEDFLREMGKLNLGSRKSRETALKEFDVICQRAIYRYANIVKSVGSNGNNLLNAKNSLQCFDCYDIENLKYCYRSFIMKDSMDVFFSQRSELLYEYTTGALNDYNVKFSYSAMDAVRDSDYTESCISSSNLFGCVSVKSKENVILNKVYSKEEYVILREKIIKHMAEMPYVDKKRRVYKYGEFFPTELSRFAYNETVAQDFFPLTQKEIEEGGYSYLSPEEKHFDLTIKSENIPDDINIVDEKILDEVLECSDKGNCDHRCMMAFRLTKDELQFYKKHNIPLPAKCSNCRFYNRLLEILPPKLWHRHCMKEGCQNEFETSYAPERPETVYCERCYQQEVY